MTDTTAPFLSIDPAVCGSRYNIVSFQFEHDLDTRGSLSLDSIIDLTRRRRDRPSLMYWSSGRVGVEDNWTAGTGRRASIEATLEAIAVNDSLVMLRRVEDDSRLGPLIRQLMARLVAIAGPRLRNDAIAGRGTLLIASPRRITSYHIDADTNFLLQIRGSKSLHVLDNGDRSRVPATELEDYFSGNPSAAHFRADGCRQAIGYQLQAGAGVHIPSITPHWAQNHDTVSIALSINFDLRSIERMGRLFRINRRLRRMGVAPAFPGCSAWCDGFKLAADGAARRLKGRLRDAAGGGAPAYPDRRRRFSPWSGAF